MQMMELAIARKKQLQTCNNEVGITPIQHETYKWIFSYDETPPLKFRSTILGNKYCHGYNDLALEQPRTIHPCQFSFQSTNNLNLAVIQF